MKSDEVAIIVGTTSLAGWQDVSITLGIETCPNSFAITFTEAFLDQPHDVSITPGGHTR